MHRRISFRAPVVMSDTPNVTVSSTPRHRSRHRARWVIAAMVALWIVAILSRNVIRARWWTHRLCTVEPARRWFYAECLASLGDRAVPTVRTLLGHRDPEVRLLAVDVLRRTETNASRDALLEAAGGSDLEVQRLAIRALSLHHDDLAAKRLREWLRDGDPRRAMIVAADYIGESLEATIEVLCGAVRTNQYPGVRVEAIVRLEELGSMRAVPALIDALTDVGVFHGETERDIHARAMWRAVRTGAEAGKLGAADLDLDVPTHYVVGARALQALRVLTSRPAPDPATPPTDRAALAEDWRTWWANQPLPQAP